MVSKHQRSTVIHVSNVENASKYVPCFCAVLGSVGVCAIIEKFLVPLGKYQELLKNDTGAVAEAEKEASPHHKVDPLLIIIIISVFLGMLVCYYLKSLDTSCRMPLFP